MTKSFLRFITLSILLYSFSACVPTERLTYLQEPTEQKNQYQLQRSAYKVQPNDILSITIRTYDLETSQLFNISNVNQNNGLQAGDILFYLQGYSIDLNGNIRIPIIGKLNVLNKSVEEIQNIVERELANYFTEEAINVTVQIAGIRFSVVGEVNLPGKYVVYQNQLNIFEALATAGDITTVGDRKEVMIVRQLPDRVETIQLDLTKGDVINSPHYFIHPNDVINIKPLPQKSLGIGTTGFQTFSQILSIVASTITLIIAINSLN
mgnify:CR=1 FL=1